MHLKENLILAFLIVYTKMWCCENDLMSVRLFEHYNKALWETVSLKTGGMIWPCISKYRIPTGSELLTWRFWTKPRLNQSICFSLYLFKNEYKVLLHKCYFSSSRWLTHFDFKDTALHWTIFRIHSCFNHSLSNYKWLLDSDTNMRKTHLHIEGAHGHGLIQKHL